MSTTSMHRTTQKTNLLKYKLLNDTGIAEAFSTTRQGGVSSEEFGSFNLSETSGDVWKNVAANREILCRELSIAANNLILSHQTHSDKIAVVDNHILNASPVERISLLNGADALITNIGGICIGVTTADCVPVLLLDPVNNAAAAIHAGWRGAVAGIARKCVEAMQCAYGTIPGNLLAAIGPCIGPESFEVGDEVANVFRDNGFDSCIKSGYSKPHIDLPETVFLDLKSAGCLPGNVEFSEICTYTHHHEYFSARRLGIRSGRILSGIVLKQR